MNASDLDEHQRADALRIVALIIAWLSKRERRRELACASRN
jgi:hypothetical protein